ncbi:MAG: ANTAR domain-containing protein [Mycobacterium sp.]|uniref:ANTAR domain-containing protein n=1 Tax=Mycobacterium sp. TaxID=1785 RepID=UPI00262D8335|nr:ANTAR domain-containing protein [Mycobacterium sp.]MDI3315829.1 ANTAR domain-containing protein [Mycobacterium sp.]
MMANWVPAQVSSDPHGGRLLGTAQGILIGLRRCSSETALHELLSAAQRHQVPVFAMAWALVHLAGGGGKSPDIFIDAQSAARHEWGQLLAGPAVSGW